MTTTSSTVNSTSLTSGAFRKSGSSRDSEEQLLSQEMVSLLNGLKQALVGINPEDVAHEGNFDDLSPADKEHAQFLRNQIQFFDHAISVTEQEIAKAPSPQLTAYLDAFKTANAALKNEYTTLEASESSEEPSSTSSTLLAFQISGNPTAYYIGTMSELMRNLVKASSLGFLQSSQQAEISLKSAKDAARATVHAAEQQFNSTMTQCGTSIGQVLTGSLSMGYTISQTKTSTQTMQDSRLETKQLDSNEKILTGASAPIATHTDATLLDIETQLTSRGYLTDQAKTEINAQRTNRGEHPITDDADWTTQTNLAIDHMTAGKRAEMKVALDQAETANTSDQGTAIDTTIDTKIQANKTQLTQIENDRKYSTTTDKAQQEARALRAVKDDLLDHGYVRPETRKEFEEYLKTDAGVKVKIEESVRNMNQRERGEMATSMKNSKKEAENSFSQASQGISNATQMARFMSDTVTGIVGSICSGLKAQYDFNSAEFSARKEVLSTTSSMEMTMASTQSNTSKGYLDQAMTLSQTLQAVVSASTRV